MTKVGDNPLRLPKRFYKTAIAGEEAGFFSIRLDGRGAKTRAGNPLCVKSQLLAAAIADEWNAQEEHINLGRMPMTRFAMTALDLGERDAQSWRSVVASFLRSDLLCYRASEPSALVDLQRRTWDPILEWCAAALNIRLKTGAGVGFLDQPPTSIETVKALLLPLPPEQLLAVKAATEISGSAVIGIALLHRAFPDAQLFEASRVDENFQAERWGVDSEAQEREARLRTDFLAAARFLSLL